MYICVSIYIYIHAYTQKYVHLYIRIHGAFNKFQTFLYRHLRLVCWFLCLMAYQPL